MGCDGKSCSSCGGCGSCGNALSLLPEELELLRSFAQRPFQPVARKAADDIPVYLENGSEMQEMSSAAIRLLERRRLIRIDYDIPLKGFDYAAYQAYPRRGSMALTARGLEVLEVLEIQGLSGEE